MALNALHVARQRRLAAVSGPSNPPGGRQPALGRHHPPRGATLSGHRPSIGRDLPLVTRLQGGSQPPQRCRQPDRQPAQPRSALRAGSPHGPTRPHGPLSAHRAADHGLRHAISAPRAPRRRPLAWGERRVWRQTRRAQGPPAPHPAPPCQFPARRRRGVEHPSRPPLSPISKSGGYRARKKIRKWKAGGGSPGPRSGAVAPNCTRRQVIGSRGNYPTGSS